METILETPRLLLRLSTPEIYRQVFTHYSREEAKKYFGLTSDEALEKEREKFTGGLTTYRTSFACFHLIEKHSGDVIGDCGFHTWYTQHARAEIGYSIWNESNKHKGFMKEAISPVVRYGFRVMGLNRIEAFISPWNMPSQKLVASLGFRQEGLLRAHYRKDGIMEDSMVFGLLRREFEL